MTYVLSGTLNNQSINLPAICNTSKKKNKNRTIGYKAALAVPIRFKSVKRDIQTKRITAPFVY